MHLLYLKDRLMPRHFLRTHYEEIVTLVERALTPINCRFDTDKPPFYYYQSQGVEAGIHFKIALPNGESAHFSYLKDHPSHWDNFLTKLPIDHDLLAKDLHGKIVPLIQDNKLKTPSPAQDISSSPLKWTAQDFTMGEKISSGVSCNLFVGQWGKQKIAIKEMKDIYLRDVPEERYNREIATMHSFTSAGAPHLVQFLGYQQIRLPGMKNDTWRLFMEYMPNGDLAQYIKTHPAVDWRIRGKIMVQITKATLWLHQQGYVHTDIKPQNVLLSADLDAKLCDFGGSKKADQTRKSDIQGTFKYLAPEVKKEETACTKNSDVFSLSITLFAVAAWSKKPHHILKKDKALPTDCPKEMKGLLQWGLHKNPQKRATIDEVHEAVLKFSQYPLIK